jgi:hypothetical protein
MMSNRFSRFGTICAHCNYELIIPEWTEHRSERNIHHLWRCEDVTSVSRPSSAPRRRRKPRQVLTLFRRGWSHRRSKALSVRFGRDGALVVLHVNDSGQAFIGNVKKEEGKA